MEFITKPFDKEYKEDVINLLNETFEGLKSEEYSEFSMEDISNSEFKEFKSYLVLEETNLIGVYGIYSAKEHPKNVIFISWFVIESQYRNKGIGGGLLEKMENEAKILDKDFLYVVAHEPSITFYSKHDFKKSKAEKLKEFYLPEDCTLMYKRL